MVANKNSAVHSVKRKRNLVEKKVIRPNCTAAPWKMPRRLQSTVAAIETAGWPWIAAHTTPRSRWNVEAWSAKAKVSRRRQIDPTTCETASTPTTKSSSWGDGRLQAAQRADVPHVHRSAGSDQVARLRKVLRDRAHGVPVVGVSLATSSIPASV